MSLIQPVILAGGRSSRFEKGHKALYPWRGVPLIDHVLDNARMILSPHELWISLARLDNEPKLLEHLQTHSDLVYLEDAPDLEGPAAGLLSAARAAHGRDLWLYVMACDMPAVRFEFVASMAELAAHASPDISAFVPLHHDGGLPVFEPLHALYRAEPLREALERAAERGVSSLQRVLDDLPGCRALDEPRLDTFDAAWRAALTSVNTLDDLETLETLLFRAGA